MASEAGHATALVIDGFPRSGNTFVANLLSRHYPAGRIVHHVHTPAAIRSGVRAGVPTLLLIRPAFEAVASLVALHLRELEKLDHTPTDGDLVYIFDRLYAYWCWYYMKCLPFADGVTVVPLETMKDRPAWLLERMTDLSADAIAQEVEHVFSQRDKVEHMLPHEARRAHQERVRSVLARHADGVDTSRGDTLYARWTDAAARP